MWQIGSHRERKGWKRRKESQSESSASWTILDPQGQAPQTQGGIIAAEVGTYNRLGDITNPNLITCGVENFRFSVIHEEWLIAYHRNFG